MSTFDFVMLHVKLLFIFILLECAAEKFITCLLQSQELK